ncbi:MAG: hypothetical protein R8G01_18045 [Ilumatobacteraceae bacterium]|nr:hypothetical protein [Ilumatobacteraceae bacterium]
MRLPGPIDDRPGRSRLPSGIIIGIGAIVVVGAVVWLTRGSDAGSPAGQAIDGSPTVSDPSADATGPRTDGSFLAPLSSPVRLVDTRSGQTTVDGQIAGIGVIAAGSTLEVPISGRSGAGTETGLVAVTITATAGPDPSEIVVQPCGGEIDASPSVRVRPSRTTIRNLLVPLSTGGTICVVPSTPVDVVLDVTAFADQAAVRPFANPVRVVDTTAAGVTADGKLAAVGVRPESSTLRVPLASRFNGLGDIGGLVVSLSAVEPLEAGTVTVFAPESTPGTPAIEYEEGTTEHTMAVVPVGAGGELCLSTTGRTDLVLHLLALIPSSALAPVEAAADASCPGQTFFPDRRVVAMYGTQRSARLGVLGEQTPSETAARLEEIAEPWRAGDEPVLPAFELIATLATGTPEDRDVYNIRSSPEFVQEYLDVARRHGYYLILDIQPGQSDFLTEAKYYEAFLRQPDVGIALDPEWRTPAPARPKGGVVGQVDASEVNQVIDYVAQLVAEEDLPEKLVIVHQFQDRMITNRDQLVERPGVALTIHMDGFGDRPNKLDSYDVVRADPPLDMGLKLFYDEDTDLLGAAEVLGGLFDPLPLLITYQ